MNRATILVPWSLMFVLSIVVLTPNSVASSAPDRPHERRVISNTLDDPATLGDLVQDLYPTVIDDLVANDLTREQAILRLGVALQLYSHALAELAHDPSTSATPDATPDGAVGPSSAALRHLESILPHESTDDPTVYPHALQQGIQDMAPWIYKELMHTVARDAVESRDVFCEELNPRMTEASWQRAHDILDEARDDSQPTDYHPTLSPHDIVVPDDAPPRAHVPSQGLQQDMVESLPDTTIGTLETAFIESLTDLTIVNDLIAGLQGVDSPQARSSLQALLETRQRLMNDLHHEHGTDDIAPSGSPEADDRPILLADRRSAEYSLAFKALPPWFDVALANMTAFFITSTGEEDDEDEPTEGRVIWDPATGTEVDPSQFDDPYELFSLEVIQGTEGAVSQRLPDQE